MKIFFTVFLVLLIIGLTSLFSWYYFGRPSNLPITTDNILTSTPMVENKKGLVLDNLKENDTIASPFKITGYTNGEGWGGFEGQVGNVSLYDINNNLLDFKPLTAVTDWMTSTVYFEANLEYTTSDERGWVVFKNENPSGDPARDKEIDIPVKLVPTDEIMKVQAYFGNSNLDPEVTCEKVFPLARVVPKTIAVARVALEELLKGVSFEEANSGYQTSINSGVQINSLSIENGVAKVDFSAELQNGVAGACKVNMIRLQIEQTLKQFSTVNSVVISINGNTEDILQP
ncbi:MAG: GerMN domain-containing protein [Candidatus Magasanikbacteria bacterium]|nr:GerMN domain-containing protein [Candidatus Magasanikbacteria bacterium]